MVWAPRQRQETPSFPKKRRKDFYVKRSLPLSGQVPDVHAGAELKVFWFFSSEKNSPT
jgi:hypothetical protein